MFVRVKKVGTYRYLQIAENRREGKRVKQSIIATLGRLDKLTASGAIDQPVALERAIASALDADAAYLGGVRHRASSRSERHHRPAAQRIRQAPTARTCPARRPAAAHPLGAPPRPRRLRPPERRIRLRR